MTKAGSEPLQQAVFAERVLLADGFAAASVVIAEGRIAAIAPGHRVEGAVAAPPGAILAPGFIDAQVNGGGGVLFNDDATPEAIARIVAAHRAAGTTGMLPTLITDRPGRIADAARAVAEARTRPGSGVLGIHLEGPFINPRRAGVHPPAQIRPMTEADADAIASLHGPAHGAVLLTLAPERTEPALIARLRAAGIVLAAGHTEADPASCAGLRGFTHLWNAMPAPASRVAGPVTAALLDDDSYAGIIADLIHVDPASLRLTLRAKGARRVFLVTDAMPVAGTDLDEFMLGGRRIRRADGRLTTEDGVLAGADLGMIDAVRNVVGALGVGLDAALRMAAEIPAEFLGIEDRGTIAIGKRADLVMLSEGLDVLATAVEGAWMKASPARSMSADHAGSRST